MSLVTWDESDSVKVKVCDTEHQKLFSLINALHEAMKSGQARSVIAGTVHELEKYTQTHFRAEEALMHRAQYAKLDEHRVEHQKFVAKIKEFKAELDAGQTDGSIKVVTFLRDWLTNHIKQVDKMYSEPLNSQGIH